MTRSCTQASAALRKGVRMRTFGRVKDWSRVSREVDADEDESSACLARNSLFLRTRARVLRSEG